MKIECKIENIYKPNNQFKMDTFALEKLTNVRVLTHDGRFHADDVIACELISIMENNNINITRSRDLSEMDSYKWVVDVGKQYDPATLRYDHHQEECNETWPGYPILLSSSGMVFRHHWNDILTALGLPDCDEKIAVLIYEKVFLPVDAHDNGQSLQTEYGKYSDGINFGRVIADMNHDDVNGPEQMKRFRSAMKYAFDSLLPVISKMVKTYNGNQKMIGILKDEVGGPILELPKNTYVNAYILSQIDPQQQLLFTIYQKKDNEFGFSAVQSKRFVNRADLIAEDKDLYPGLIFIHKKRFCGSASDVDTAWEICEESVRIHNTKKMRKYMTYGALGGVCSLACAYLWLKR